MHLNRSHGSTVTYAKLKQLILRSRITPNRPRTNPLPCSQLGTTIVDILFPSFLLL